MTRFVRRLLPVLGLALALAGCVAYPAGYGYYGAPYAPAPAYAYVPCCAYVGFGGGWHGGGYGYHHW